MGLSRNAQPLIEFAESIELYAHTSRVVVRLEMGDYDAALSMCRHAVAQCSELVKMQPSGPRREHHAANYQKLRLLEAMIAETHLRAESESQVTLF